MIIRSRSAASDRMLTCPRRAPFASVERHAKRRPSGAKALDAYPNHAEYRSAPIVKSPWPHSKPVQFPGSQGQRHLLSRCSVAIRLCFPQEQLVAMQVHLSSSQRMER